MAQTFNQTTTSQVVKMCRCKACRTETRLMMRVAIRMMNTGGA